MPFFLELEKTIPRRGTGWTATLLDRGFWNFYHRKKYPTTPEDGELVRKKVVSVRLKDYIEVGSVINCVHHFYAKKGIYHVRMVCNGTGCGLKDSIWAPHFVLSTMRHMLRSLLPGYSQCDLYIG